LRQSVNVSVAGEGAKVVGMVGTALEYGKCLEYGTRSILPRPWLRLSFEKSKQKIHEIFSRGWF